MTIKELSRQLKRNYSNVHGDVELLLKLGLLDKDGSSKVYVPWDELNLLDAARKMTDAASIT